MLDLDLDQLATLLSELSQPGQIPKLDGSPNAPSSFSADEISFETSEWLARVLEVRIWLNFDAIFDDDAVPEEVALRLFDELVPGKASTCFNVLDGVVVLTEIGAQNLEERLTRAVSYRAIFDQSIEDDNTIAASTAEWLESWNEPDSVEPVAINASVDTWRIQDLAGYAEENELDLNPTFQRDFIWSNSSSQMLIESILRGIPLPSIILARVSNSDTYQIVDGKQRLTSILRFMGKHPEGLEKSRNMKEADLFGTDFAKFARRNSLRAADIRKNYFPFKTRKFSADDPIAHLGGRYYCDIRDEKVQIAGKTTKVVTLFEKTSNYHIPVLIYEDTPIRQIHRVFNLYNQQGMKLNAEEIRNATYNHLLISRLMLFISGDRPEKSIAPEFVTAGIEPSEAHEIIDNLGFGKTRFKRTKILLWTVATLILKPSQAPDGSYRMPSTAKHIDEFLESIHQTKLAMMKEKEGLVKLGEDIIEALTLHEIASDAWHPGFRRKGKSEMATRWEELPVVGSLIACLVIVILGEQDLLLRNIEPVRQLTADLKGPESTQNRTQWAHIANSAISIIETLGIDPNAAETAVQARYGHSAISALTEIRKIPI